MSPTPPQDLQRNWLLQWEQLDMPAWGVDPDNKISFINKHAEILLGLTSAECVGRRCEDVICTSDQGSDCASCCLQRSVSCYGRPAKPKSVMVEKPDGSSLWIQLMPILMSSPDGEGPHVLVTAINIDRWARIEQYVMKIAERRQLQEPVGWQELTARESEVLELLAQDMVQNEIAGHLHISYTTVRSHVQHILAKLRVRSIQAAVACHLLDRTGTG